MKKVAFTVFAVSMILGAMFGSGCKKADRFDARGTLEVTVLDTNGNSTETYTLTGSRENGTVTGGYSEMGTGTSNIFNLWI